MFKISRQKEKDIYFEHAQTMYKVCFRYLGNKEIAEEIVNDGFLKVFKFCTKNKFETKNAFRNWIKKIMINECLMYLRKKEKMIFTEFKHENQLVIEPVYPKDKSSILEVIRKLPVGCRTVFNLYAIDELSHKEIADKWGITVKVSRVRVMRARQQIQSKLHKLCIEKIGV